MVSKAKAVHATDTFTLQVANLLPQVAVIVQEPIPTDVTTPLFTVAIPVLDDFHVTVSVVLLGVTVATNDSLPFIVVKFIILAFKLIPVHATDTFTLQVADLLPQVAVIVQEPIPTDVTTPLFTVATLLFDDCHVIGSVVSAGITVAFNTCCVFNAVNDKSYTFKATPVDSIIDVILISSKYLPHIA